MATGTTCKMHSKQSYSQSRIFIYLTLIAVSHTLIGLIWLFTPMDIPSLLYVQNIHGGLDPVKIRFIYESKMIKQHAQPGESQSLETLQPMFNVHHFLMNLSYIPPLVNCNQKKYRVIVFINSGRQNILRRTSIRDNWANQQLLTKLQICLIFVIGKYIQNEIELMDAIEQERLTNGDILEGNFIDNTNNNTLKCLTALAWSVSCCADIGYVLVADDSTIFNFEILMSKVLQKTAYYPESFWMGQLEMNRMVSGKSGSLSYVSKRTYSEKVMPPFCSKVAGFVLSSKAVKQTLKLAENSYFHPRIDFYLAIALKKSKFEGMKIINNKYFSVKSPDVCSLKHLATAQGMFSSDTHEIYWRNLSSIAFLKDCPDPDLDLVLMQHVSNIDYFEKALLVIHSNEHACANIETNPGDIILVAFINTLPRNNEKRNAIRRTWGAPRKIQNAHIRVFFVSGVTQTYTKLNNDIIDKEMLQHKDIIQSDFHESFQNLTLKVVLGLKWMTEHCTRAKFFYKGDDDMFVNFERIVSYLTRITSKPRSSLFLGQTMYASMTVRIPTSKYYISKEVYSGKYFSPYCSGGGYIITTDIIPAMYNVSLKTPLLPIDDAYQGILAKQIGISPTMNTEFHNYPRPSDHCSLQTYMTLHGFKTVEMLMKVWDNYTDTTVCPDNDEYVHM